MRSLSDLIAPTHAEHDHKPIGPFAAAMFVLAVVVSTTGAAYFIGAAIADRPAVTADAGFD